MKAIVKYRKMKKFENWSFRQHAPSIKTRGAVNERVPKRRRFDVFSWNLNWRVTWLAEITQFAFCRHLSFAITQNYSCIFKCCILNLLQRTFHWQIERSSLNLRHRAHKLHGCVSFYSCNRKILPQEWWIVPPVLKTKTIEIATGFLELIVAASHT